MRSRRSSGSAGGALVEFAVILIVAAPVLIGGLQLAQALTLFHQLDRAVYRGAETASLTAWDSTTEEPTPAFRRVVENAVLYGSPEARGALIAPGLGRGHVRLEIAWDRARPRVVTVSIDGYGLPLPGSSISLRGRPRATLPYRGRLAQAR